MAWTIEYLSTAKRQLKKLDTKIATRIISFLGERIAKSGEPYALGSALVGEWSGYWHYRVGDYRIVCKIRDEALVVLVVKVAHRSDVYR